MTSPSITENLRYDDLSGVRTPACVLPVKYLRQQQRVPALLRGMDLARNCYDVHAMATARRRAIAVPAQVTQLASGPIAQSCRFRRWDT